MSMMGPIGPTESEIRILANQAIIMSALDMLIMANPKMPLDNAQKQSKLIREAFELTNDFVKQSIKGIADETT